MGKLYLVATPIGNLSDISFRTLEVLKAVNSIYCEDTRHTQILLSHYQIQKPLFIYEEYNELQKIPQILEKLKSGEDIALVSDAGTPTLSDPGFKLVREVIKEGLEVVSIPGPSAILTALTSSGLPTDKFIYLGYLPKKPGHRLKTLQNIAQIQKIIAATVIFFEAPHHLLRTLEEMLEVFGDLQIVLCRELTKVHEEIRREKISQALEHFKKVNPRGEFTVLMSLQS